MFLRAGTRLIVTPIFEPSTITVKPQLFLFCALTVSKCGGFLLDFELVYFCQLVLSYPLPPMPSPFRVIYNLAASAQSPEPEDMEMWI